MQGGKMKLSRMICIPLVLVTIFFNSGCYRCGGDTKPCPPDTPPSGEKCTLSNHPWPAGGCKGAEGTRGCPEYYETTVNLPSYCYECEKYGPIISTEIIEPGDEDYEKCPVCDASQCPVKGYFILSGTPCVERPITVPECRAACTYPTFKIGDPPTA
jgi:hypothetical protein